MNMSARVMNPALMTEMSRNLGGSRVSPSRAALAKVRRDLFGPVDHAAARALADSELKTQSKIDAQRWGFDFHLEIPVSNSRYDWQAIGPKDVVPEPYALRGMPYLRKHAPTTSRKAARPSDRSSASVSPVVQPSAQRTPSPRVPGIVHEDFDSQSLRKKCEEPTTPILPVVRKNQSSITDFMKSRKRTLNGSTKKSMVEPPEKIARNAGPIRS